MAKRISEDQRKSIINHFKGGASIEALSNEYDCTHSTIMRHLKKDLGPKIYKELVHKNKKNVLLNNFKEDVNSKKKNNNLKLEVLNNDFIEHRDSDKGDIDSNLHLSSEFIEISPLNIEIENNSRKELSSIPIEDVDLPKIVYMIVNKNIELEIKSLRDYPDWEFLPIEDLKRKTIEIFFDLKKAKRVCNKEQKVIKVPNTDVFRIVSSILIGKGISRIVSPEELIAL